MLVIMSNKKTLGRIEFAKCSEMKFRRCWMKDMSFIASHQKREHKSKNSSILISEKLLGKVFSPAQDNDYLILALEKDNSKEKDTIIDVLKEKFYIEDFALSSNSKNN